jgi:2-phospho-L-lactate guanylyltransferase
MRAILIPVKDPTRAKKRLAGLLSPEERRRLVWAMFEDVARAVAESRLADRVFVVTSCEAVMRAARSFGWGVVAEDRQLSESESIDVASRQLARLGFDAVMRVPADLPLARAEDLDALFEFDLNPPASLLVPSRDGTGTNVLLRSPADLFPSRFGPNSLRLHLEEAARAGSRCSIVKNDRLALDIDEPADIAELFAVGRGTHAHAALIEMGIFERIKFGSTAS